MDGSIRKDGKNLLNGDIVMNHIINNTSSIPEITSTLIEDSTLGEYKNEITDFLDSYLTLPFKKIVRKGYTDGTYMIFHKEAAAIRFPGATRACVCFNEDSIITDILFYNDVSLIYKKEGIEKVNKFIGYKLIIPDIRF